MSDDEVGSLADELQLLAAVVGAQDPGVPDTVLDRVRRYLDGVASSTADAPDVQRIDLS